jgi:hypothetical protein
MTFVDVRVTRFLPHDAQRGLTSDRLVSPPLLHGVREFLHFHVTNPKLNVK